MTFEPPPSRRDVDRSFEQLHRSAEQVERRSQRTASQISRRWGLLTLVIAVLLSMVVSTVAVMIAFRALAGQQASDAQAAQTRDTVQLALSKLDEANQQLQARGQAPVVVPPSPDVPDALAAAVTARVLAGLPKAPSAEQVGAAIQGTVTANLLGPSAAQIATQVSQYFADHPPQPGPPPSEAAIRAAVDKSLAANPPPAGPKGDTGAKGDKGDQCSPTDPSCVGPKGDKGDKGDTGAAGPPPAGWTFTDRLGNKHSCTRDTSSPDSAPTYTCS